MVSTGFKLFSVTHFLFAIIECIDKNKFSDSLVEDHLTPIYQKGDRFISENN